MKWPAERPGERRPAVARKASVLTGNPVGTGGNNATARIQGVLRADGDNCPATPASSLKQNSSRNYSYRFGAIAAG